MGREWGTSANIDPKVMTKETSRSSAKSSNSRVKLFQRIDGSVPLTMTKSRSNSGKATPKISVVGQVILRICDSST